jgi:hypothetical protein
MSNHVQAGIAVVPVPLQEHSKMLLITWLIKPSGNV